MVDVEGKKPAKIFKCRFRNFAPGRPLWLATPSELRLLEATNLYSTRSEPRMFHWQKKS